MKNYLILAFFLLAGFTVKAQRIDTNDPQQVLVGTWEVQQQDKREIRLKSLVFFADGIININYAGSKRVQRYKVSKDEQGYTLQLLEMINGKPLEKISILKFSPQEMELGAKDETRELTVRCKKVGT